MRWPRSKKGWSGSCQPPLETSPSRGLAADRVRRRPGLSRRLDGTGGRGYSPPPNKNKDIFLTPKNKTNPRGARDKVLFEDESRAGPKGEGDRGPSFWGGAA